MKVTKIDLNPERKLLQYMITNTQFLKEIVPIFHSHYLKVSYCRLVSEWIIEYYEQYKEAPNKNIQEIYKSKKKTIINEEDTESIGTFLTKLSQDWEQANPNNIDYSVSEAIKYLNVRSLEILNEDIQNSIQENEPDKGAQSVSNYKRVEKPFGKGVSLLKDTNSVIRAFTDEDETLFTFKGALGKVAGKLCRGDFLLFLAPMKRGKTWFLWYTAETALYNGLKVLFISLEMTEKQMVRRAWRSLIGQPMQGGEYKYRISIK
jgi:replicative DNA helicase